MIQNHVWNTVRRQAREFYAVKGWKQIGSQRHYFKSKAEVKCAHHLQEMQENDKIESWEYEPQIFYFEGIKRGCTNYTPDFKVNKLNGETLWVEVKGYMDPKSKTKIKRFEKYYPNERLLVICDENFLKINVEIEKSL